MAAMRYRAVNNHYAVSGSAALAGTYTEDEPAMQHVDAASRRAIRRTVKDVQAQKVRREGIELRTVLTVVAAVVLVLGGILVTRCMEANDLRQNIEAMEAAIAAAAENTRNLQDQLDVCIDGETIRNQAVNVLGMTTIRDEEIRTVNMPNTRPLAAYQQVAQPAQGTDALAMASGQ